MNESSVVAVFVRNAGEILLLRRRDSRRLDEGNWGPVAGPVPADRWTDDVLDSHGTDDERSPEDVARREIRRATGLSAADVALVRRGEPVLFEDQKCTRELVVHPYLFDCESRAIETDAATIEHEWVPSTEILRREAVPALWTAYDRIRPRVATIREDTAHGSSSLSHRALEVLRDEAALAVEGHDPDDSRVAASDSSAGAFDGNAWDGLATIARDLIDARPSMDVVANRLNCAMCTASDRRTPESVETAASRVLGRALSADSEAATRAAGMLPDRVGTLSRSGTVMAALREAAPQAVLVAESRPGREGVGVAESLVRSPGSPSDEGAVTLTTDAAFPFELDAWDAEALLLGADRILPNGRVVNKVGTRAAALATPEECPCYVVAASDKVATDDDVDLAEGDPTAVYDGDRSIDVATPTFDVTPAAAVDAVITENKPLDADGISTLATTHREWADWD